MTDQIAEMEKRQDRAKSQPAYSGAMPGPVVSPALLFGSLAMQQRE